MSTTATDRSASANKAAEITNGNRVCSVTFTTDGKHVVAGDDCGGIRRWKIEDSRQVGITMTTTGQVGTIAVSQDARWIVTGDWGMNVIVWNATTHQKVLKITDCQYWIWAVDISSDSTRIAVGSGEKAVRIFSITTGAQLLSPIRHGYAVVSLKFSPTGDRIAAASYNHTSVRIYNSHTGDKLFEVPVQVLASLATPLNWSPDGLKVFAVSPGKIACLDTSTSTCSVWPTVDVNSQGSTSIVTNGGFIACSAGTSVSFWDVISRKQIGPTLRHTTTIQCIALSSDEEYLACGNGDKISLHHLSEVLPSSYLAPPVARPPLMEVSLAALDLWKQDEIKRAEAVLSAEIKQPSASHHVLANRALIRARLKQWNTALEDANMSLQINPSPIGHIAKALALVGLGDKNLALSEFDFAFGMCDPNDVKLLLVIKAIVIFASGDHEDSIFRITGLTANADEDMKYYCSQVLGNMYMLSGDYEGAIRSLRSGPSLAASGDSPQLTTITLIFGWDFCEIETVAWLCLCATLHSSGRIKEVGENLLKMVNPLTENEREAAHCLILEEIVTRSGDVALLSWTGQSSAYNSCLPASPAVYTQSLFTPPILEGAEMELKITELRTSFPQIDALIIHDWVTRLQAARIANGRLLLPCLPFRVQSLSNNEGNRYSAKVTWLGDIEFTTDDVLPLNQPRRLVFVHPWIRRLCNPQDKVNSEDDFELDGKVDANTNEGSGSGNDINTDPEIVHASASCSPVEEITLTPSDTYTRALQLIAQLGQPFNALLLLKQPDGTYRRVAAEHEILVPGLGRDVPKDIRPEVLEVV